MKTACISRGSLIGDSVSIFPAIQWYKKQNPDSYISFILAKKCKQLAPLIRNHSLIDRVLVTEHDESLGESDYNYLISHDFYTNPFPQHRDQQWYNHRSFYEENAGDMIDFDYSQFEEKYPILERYWNKKVENKTIAIQSVPGYGQGSVRGPSVEWWDNLLVKLHDLGYITFQVGSPNDPKINTKYDYRLATFENLVKNILDCEYYIGGDSGLSILIAAYREIKQINLMTNWLPNHTSNLLSLAPRGDDRLILDFFVHGSCNNIDINDVIRGIRDL